MSKTPRVLALVALVVSCSSDDGAEDADAFAARYCDLFKPCCAKAGWPTEQAGCRFTYGERARSASAGQCLKDLEAQAKDPAFCDFTLAEPDSCLNAFTEGPNGPKKQPGEACLEDADCAGDSTCHQALCASFAVVGEGTTCLGEREGRTTNWSGDPQQAQIRVCDFAAGMYCNGVCTKRSPPGQACTSSHECVEGAYCDGSVCALRLAAGSACSGLEDECDDQTFCSSSTSKCEPRLSDGQSCSIGAECASGYCDTGTCKAWVNELPLTFVCQ